QGAVLEIDARQLTAQPLDHEMLKVENPLADLARRDAQQTQRLWVTLDEIGMLLQISDNFAAADLRRRRDGRQCGSVALDLRLVARPGGPRRAPSPRPGAG